MYINNIDTILAQILNNSYTSILKSKTFANILKTPNFSTKYENIAKLLDEQLGAIDFSKVKEILTDNKISKIVIDILKSYIGYYLFVSIGYFYGDNIDTFKNNVVEISKLINKNMVDVPNFFTSVSNANIISLVDIANGIREIILDDKADKSTKKRELYYKSFKVLEEMGETASKFKNRDKLIQGHNIINAVIITQMYFVNDKPEIARLLETVDANTGESIYIDVSFPLEKKIDIAEIETTLTQEEIDRGDAKNILDLLEENEQLTLKNIQTTESKITDLINNGLLIPITEDFLLYHDDNERYDVQKSDDRKFEQLKIKYILDKIYSAESVDIRNPEAVKKNKFFSNVHANRLAITYNILENSKILNKAGKATRGEPAETANELLNYIRYPYVNFKIFKKNGFQFMFDKTKSVVRSISFDKIGSFTTSNRNSIQTRVGGDNQQVNVVGFVIPNWKKSIECMRVKDVSEITGYDSLIDSIRNAIDGKQTDNKYWYFDLNTDTKQLTTYEHFESMEQSELCKLVCAKIRDDIVNIVYDRISNVLSKFTNLTFVQAFKIIEVVMRNTFQISENDPKFIEIKKLVYHKLYQKYIPIYDIKDDNVFGIVGELHELPTAKEKKKDNVLRLSTGTKQKRIADENEEIFENALCQHNVSWETLLEQQKIGGMKFVELMHEFTQLFVEVNNEQEYVCKSCGVVLNDLRKYVPDGEYDSATQRFIAYGVQMKVALEDLPEYRKYKTAISGMDRLIDQKIANILNLSFIEGHMLTQKIQRTELVRDTIDLILLNNSYLKRNDMKQRNMHVQEKYGIGAEVTNLFQFELDNSIFIVTSGEKDFFKARKYNNIIAYILFLILLELNDHQIMSLSSGKSSGKVAENVCNYLLYEKFGEKTLSGLRIRINNKGDVRPITDFPLLAYTIYIMTCILSKYSIWYLKDSDDKAKKVNPLKQKIMIHTIVDVMNTIMELSETVQNKRIYEIVRSKFYNKLWTTYSNTSIIERIRDENKFNGAKQEIDAKGTKLDVIVIDKEYKQATLDHIEYNKYLNERFYSDVIDEKYFNKQITNMTHCKSGTIHSFEIDKSNMKRVKCGLCGVYLDELKYDKELTETILSAVELRQLEKFGDYFCITGERHNYVYEQKLQKRKCKRCGYIEGDYLTGEQLKQLRKNVTRPDIIKDIIYLDKKKEKHDEFVNNVFKDLRSRYVESKSHRDDYYKFIDDFIKVMQSEVGNIIDIDGKRINLTDDTYVIDHNNMGYQLEKPVSLSGYGPEISFKNNHPFYKKDIIMYSPEKNAKIVTFYDAHTFVLLGYKEINKDFVLNVKTENRIHVEYSLKNKLRYLGSETKYVNVADNEFLKTKSDEEITEHLSRERIAHIGDTIYHLIINLNRLKKQYKEPVHIGLTDEIDELDIGIKFNLDKYLRKLKNIQTKQEKTKVFKLWYLILQNLHYSYNKNKEHRLEKHSGYVDIEDTHNYDYSGNLMLFYMTSEVMKLLDLNTDKSIRKYAVEFLIDYINYSFNQYNIDYLTSNNELRKFETLLGSSEYIYELEKGMYGMESFDKVFGEEKTKEELDEETDEKERKEALDIDGEVDYEDEFENSYPERGFDYDSTTRDYELVLN